MTVELAIDIAGVICIVLVAISATSKTVAFFSGIGTRFKGIEADINQLRSDQHELSGQVYELWELIGEEEEEDEPKTS